MKATGVVRRIDDLGRIVLPKELRRTMRIKEGESLEIYTDGTDRIILKNILPYKMLMILLRNLLKVYMHQIKKI